MCLCACFKLSAHRLPAHMAVLLLQGDAVPAVVAPPANGNATTAAALDDDMFSSGADVSVGEHRAGLV